MAKPFAVALHFLTKMRLLGNYMNCKFSVKLLQCLADISEYRRTIHKLSFGTTEMAACANKFFVCLFVKNMDLLTGLILNIRSVIK